MKKNLLLLLIFLLGICSLFGNDNLIGVWVLNTFSVRTEQKTSATFSWGDGYKTKTKGFIIDKDARNALFIEMNEFGKFPIIAVEEKDGTWYVSFSSNSGKSKEILTFKKINCSELYIVESEKITFLPSGINNRYFKLQGPSNSCVLNLPISVTIKKDTPIKWNSSILGYVKEDLVVEVLGVSNDDTYLMPVSEKKYLIKIADEYLRNYNEEFYSKQNLVKTEKNTYGYILGDSIKYLKNFNLQ